MLEAHMRHTLIIVSHFWLAHLIRVTRVICVSSEAVRMDFGIFGCYCIVDLDDDNRLNVCMRSILANTRKISDTNLFNQPEKRTAYANCLGYFRCFNTFK